MSQRPHDMAPLKIWSPFIGNQSGDASLLLPLSVMVFAVICVNLSEITLVRAATIGIPQYQPQQPVGTKDYQKGMAALARGDVHTAKQAFEQALHDAPNHVGAILGMAEIAWKEKNSKNVEKYLQQAKALAPKNVLVHQAWGKHLIQQGQFREAEQAFQTGIALEPKLTSLHIQLGDLYLQLLREPQRAITAYQDALATDASQARAHYGIGMAHVALQQPQEAKDSLNRAIGLSPNNPLPYYSLGRLYLAEQAFDDAHQALNTAIRLQPKFLEAYLTQGDAYIHQQKDAEALGAYEQALLLAPKAGSIYVKIGLLHERNHRTDEAAKAFEQAITLDPKQAIAFNNLAWIAAQKNIRLDEALVWAQRAVALAPKVSAFQDTLGWILRLRGDLDEAADILSTASELRPEIPDIYYHLGIVETDRGNTKDAISALTRALELAIPFADSSDAQRRLDDLTRH